MRASEQRAGGSGACQRVTIEDRQEAASRDSMAVSDFPHDIHRDSAPPDPEAATSAPVTASDEASATAPDDIAIF